MTSSWERRKSGSITLSPGYAHVLELHYSNALSGEAHSLIEFEASDQLTLGAPFIDKRFNDYQLINAPLRKKQEPTETDRDTETDRRTYCALPKDQELPKY